jgi:hypothetical protein
MFHQLANIDKEDRIVKLPLDKIIFEDSAYYFGFWHYFLSRSPQSGQNV